MKKTVLFLFPIITFLASLQFPFVYWPEMLNWPFVLAQGWLPYRDFSVIHTPVLPLALTGWYQVFGFTPEALRFFGAGLLAITNLLVILSVWRLTKRLAPALLAGFLHLYFSLAFEGNTVWFESLLTPVLLWVFWLQWQYVQNKQLGRLFLAGVLMGIAVLIKQTAVVFVAVFGVTMGHLLIKRETSWRNLARPSLVYFLPIVVLAGAFLAVLWRLNILYDFYRWAVVFPFSLPGLQKSILEPDLLLPTFRQASMLAVFVGVAAISVFWQKTFTAVFLFAAMCLSLLFAFPRFAYFHLLPSLSFFALLIAFGLAKARWYEAVVVIGTVCLLTLPVLRKTILIGQRFLNKEVVEVAWYLERDYSPATIFSLNGPDLVYFLTGKEPAVKPWVDQLPWELEFGAKEFTASFITRPPDVIVHRPYLDKPIDGLGVYRPETVYQFMLKNYHKAKTFSGGVEIWEKLP